MNKAPIHPARVLRGAVSSLRTVGTVFVLIGGIFCSVAVGIIGGRRSSQDIQVLASASFFLLTPGILYHLAAIFIGKQDVKMALLAQRTAMCQSILGLLATVIFSTWSGPKPMALLCAIPVCFFIPALIAQALQISKALIAMRSLSNPQRGFEVLAVLPVQENTAPDPEPVHPAP